MKICGIRTLPALEAAIAAGAEYYGMVFYPPSPRNVSLSAAARLVARARGRIKSVALVVDADDAAIEAIIAAADPDMIQLHGSETPQRVRAIRKLAGRPVIKAVKVARKGDAEAAEAYKRAADLIVFDAKAPARRKGALPGGNGRSFDWRLLSSRGGGRKACFMLSGGLTAENVAEAIRVTGAPIVDVSSGVEVAPGKKQAALIRRFMAAVKAPEVEELAHG